MVQPDLDRFSSRRSTAYAPTGIVATSQPLAAQAGVTTLQSGGNAFDAAVATAAALNVVEPTSTGLGGDVFACYRTANGEIGAMQSCGGAPADATVESVRNAIAADRGTAPDSVEMPFHGPHTVTVPGTARGWEATIERFGRRSLAEALEPAIGYATGGYPVTEIIASAWTHGEDLFEDPQARESYLIDGERAPSVGEMITLPRLGNSLRAIAENGADVVYEGEIAESIAGEVQAVGGFLTVEDLAAFEPTFVEPISTTYAGAEVYELPPNNQGLLVLEALNIAEELGAREHAPDSPDRVHALVEAMKLAFHDGHHYVTDPEYQPVPDLHARGYARERAELVGSTALDPVPIGMPDAGAEDADTVLLTVADEAGNVVSYINSRYAGFGSGLVAGDTGIALQNRGASFSLDLDHPNHLEPGKRPFHTLIPGLVRFDTDDWAAFGVMGGYMQPQGHLQVLSHLLDDDRPLQRSLDEPRWRYREDGRLAIEARHDDALLTALARRGHDVSIRPPGEFGGAQIARYRRGVLSAATEPRKDGVAIGY